LDAREVHERSCGALALADAGAAGRGLVAARPLRAGEVVLAEPALLWVPSTARAAFSAATPAAAQAFLGAMRWRCGGSAFAALSQLCPLDAAARAEASLRRTLALAAPAPLPPPLAAALAAKLAVDANAFASGALSVVGFVASLLNHSCLPNVVHAWRSPAGADAGAPSVRVVALRDVAAGEPVCTRYVDVEARPRHARKALLRARYGFDCGCPRCAAPSARGDDAVRLRCTACGEGFVLGGARQGMAGGACSACAAPAAGGDDALDDRADLLRALLSARGDAAAAAAAAAGLKALLHTSDAALFRVLFNEALAALQPPAGRGQPRLQPLAEAGADADADADCGPLGGGGDSADADALADADADAARRALALTAELVAAQATMPHLQPTTREAVLALRLRACAAAGAADAAAEAELAAVRVCLAPLRAADARDEWARSGGAEGLKLGE
jgi:hypothetical protein